MGAKDGREGAPAPPLPGSAGTSASAVDPPALARAYAAAHYAAVRDGRDIPFAVGVLAAGIEAAWPRERYGFITAWNPASDPRSGAENDAADARLVARLDADGVARLEAWAADDQGRWRESGWLLGDVDDARLFALARGFGQAGVLRWRRGEPVRLAMLVRRRASDAGPAFTDWVE